MYQPVVIKFYHIYVLLFQWMSSILFALIGLDVRIIILDTEWTHCNSVSLTILERTDEVQILRYLVFHILNAKGQACIYIL